MGRAETQINITGRLAEIHTNMRLFPRQRIRRLISLAAAALAIAIPVWQASAASVYTGPATAPNDAWNTSANWNGGAGPVPSTGPVYIGVSSGTYAGTPNATVDLSAVGGSAGYLTLAAGSSIVNSSTTVGVDLNATGASIAGTIDGQHNAGITLNLGGGALAGTGTVPGLAGNLALNLSGNFDLGSASNTYSAGTSITSSINLGSSSSTPPTIPAVPVVATFSNSGDEGGVSSSSFGGGAVQLDNGTMRYNGTGPATLIAGNAIILTDSGNGSTKIGSTTYTWLPSINTIDAGGQTMTVQGAIENAGANTAAMPIQSATPGESIGTTNQTGDALVFQNGTFDLASTNTSSDFTTGTIQVGNGLVANGSGGYAPASTTTVALDAIGSQGGAGSRLSLYQGTLKIGINGINIAASLESTVAIVSSASYVGKEVATNNMLDLAGHTATLSGNMASDVETLNQGATGATKSNSININAGNLTIGSSATGGGGTLTITGNNSAFGDYGDRTVNGATQPVSDGAVTLESNVTIQLDSSGGFQGNLGAGVITIGPAAAGAPIGSPGATIQYLGANQQLGNSVDLANALTVDLDGNSGIFGYNSPSTQTFTSDLTGSAGLLVTNSKTTAGTLTMNGAISTYPGVITIDNALTTLNIVNAIVGSLNNFAFNTGGTLVAGGDYVANNQVIGPVTLNENNATDIVDANGSVVSDPLGLGGSITNDNNKTTLLLQNGAFDLTSTNNTAFSAGTLQIGNGTAATVVQFGRSLGAADLPGAGAGITLDNGVLSYIGNSTAQMVNAITLAGTGTITANAQTLGLAGVTGDTLGSAQTLTLQNGTFDLAGSNIGVGELITTDAAGGGLATITNSSATVVGHVNILPDDMATPTASAIAGNIDGGTGAGIVLTLGSGATARTVESSTFSGTLSGNLTLIFTGADGSADLGTNVNTFLDGTTVENNAIVKFGNGSSFGAATSGITLNSGTLTYTGTTAATVANAITLTGAGTIMGNAQSIGLTGGVIGTGQLFQMENGNYDLGGSNLTVGDL